MRNLFDACAVVAATLGVVAASWGQCGISKLLASDGGANEQFGSTVAISPKGDTVVAGVLYHDELGGPDAGAAWVFVRDGSSFIELIELVPSDDTEYFGRSVAISDDGSTIAVGAISDHDAVPNGGSVYVYERRGDTWVEEAELLPADPQIGVHEFGCSVALSADGGIVLIGARFDDDACGPPPWCNSGAGYVFARRDGGWAQEAKLVGAGWTGGEHGYSVALSGDGGTAVLGAPSDDAVVHKAGSVAVFTREAQQWRETGLLTAPDAGEYDSFGLSVDISSDSQVLAVGAPNRGSDGAGAVYVFVRIRDRWQAAGTLLPQDSFQPVHVGNSVAVSSNGDSILAGAPVLYEFPSPPCAAYVFRRQGETDWVQEARFFGFARDDELGRAVALSGDAMTAVIAAPGHEEAGEPGVGAVFVVDRACRSDIDLDGVVGIGDLLTLLGAWGPCAGAPANCPADLDAGGAVDPIDLLLLLAEWQRP